MLFVGDFYQHTYSTSYDGNANINLFDDYDKYIKKFLNFDFVYDNSTLSKSYRCSKDICDFVLKNLNININGIDENNTKSIIQYVENDQLIKNLNKDDSIIKLHYRNSSKYGINHKNWGDVK